MKQAAWIILMLVGAHAHADDAVLFDFVLTEQMSETNTSTHEFAFLIHFDKLAAAEMGGRARLEVEARDNVSSTSVALGLFDFDESGSRFEVGTVVVDAPFDATTSVAWPTDGNAWYSLQLTPRRRQVNR